MDTERSRSVQNATEAAATAEDQAAPKTENLESEEWELSDVPDEWKPAPLFKVWIFVAIPQCAIFGL